MRPAPTRPATPRTSPRRSWSVAARGLPPAAGEVVHLEHDFARHARRARVEVFDVAADHQRDDPILRRVAGRAAADGPAVAKDGEAVGDLRHLLEEVGDVDDRQPLRPQPADEVEQVADVADGSGCWSARRARARGSRSPPRGRSRPSAATRSTARRPARPAGCRRGRASPAPRPRARRTSPQRTSGPRRRLHAEQDVLHHRQVRRERQLLVDHRHAGPAGVERVAQARRAGRRATSARRRAGARRTAPSSACSCRRRFRRRARALRRR